MHSTHSSGVLCCQCGVLIEPNSANMCVPCLSTEVDIVKDVERQNTIVFCPKCERYLIPPSKWVVARTESPELLAMCLKRVRGLNKGLRVHGAKFIWTEPHSKRINIEVTVRGELSTGDLVEQQVLLVFVMHPQQCSDCTRSAAKDYWNACVQVRQRVEHKRTLLNLEQIILRCSAHSECNNIKQVSDGMDFYFNSRSQAVTFVNFLCKRAPCRYQTSQHLKSHDAHNNTYNYKFTFSVEVAGICKNDIVCLSKTQSQRLGGIGPLCIVRKVAEVIHLIDPTTCQTSHVDSTAFFASPFTAIAHQKQLTAFVVVEIEEDSPCTSKIVAVPVGAHLSKRHRVVSVWLMRVNQQRPSVHLDSDTQEDGMVHARSHLGHLLQVGDTVYGLDLRSCNVNHPEFEQLSEAQRPDVILVFRPPQHVEESELSSGRHNRSKRRRKHVGGTADTSTVISEVTSDAMSCETSEVDLGNEEEEEDNFSDDETVYFSDE